MTERIFRPSDKPRQVIDESGQRHAVPSEWELLPPGDAACTRRVKKAGEYWQVQQKRGRRTFSAGIWAPAATIAEVQRELESERATESYAKRRAGDKRRRDEKQRVYVDDFHTAVLAFLRFHQQHAAVAEKIATAVAEHATPVGSGTVARTQRIPIEQKAEAAVIAWMRHQTTGYDSMVIPRVKGKRREIRRMLAARSKELLNGFRRGAVPSDDFPLLAALRGS
jgi:hypothetical protein